MRIDMGQAHSVNQDGSAVPLVDLRQGNPPRYMMRFARRSAPIRLARPFALSCAGDAIAIYPAGGSTGQLLRHLMARENIRRLLIEIDEETRQDFNVTEEKSGQQCGPLLRRCKPLCPFPILQTI
jgi:hypothetical protein